MDAGRPLAAWLPAEPLDAVLRSPLRRAVQTAEPLAEVTGLEVQIVDGLSEWDRQSSSYVPIEELRAANDPMWKSLAAGALHELGVDGPSFQGRVVAAVDGIAAAHAGQTVAVVCHGGVLNAYLSAVLGLDRVLFFPPDYTCINRVRSGARASACCARSTRRPTCARSAAPRSRAAPCRCARRRAGPSTRSPRMFFMTSVVPPSIELARMRRNAFCGQSHDIVAVGRTIS